MTITRVKGKERKEQRKKDPRNPPPSDFLIFFLNHDTSRAQAEPLWDFQASKVLVKILSHLSVSVEKGAEHTGRREKLTIIIFNAFLLLRYGIGAFSSATPTKGIASLFSAISPPTGNSVCSNSYAANVAPNCGLDLKILAGPPL